MTGFTPALATNRNGFPAIETGLSAETCSAIAFRSNGDARSFVAVYAAAPAKTNSVSAALAGTVFTSQFAPTLQWPVGPSQIQGAAWEQVRPKASKPVRA